MTEIYNPSLRQIPRSQKAEVLPAQKEPSILVWLESTGRLKPREDLDVREEADSEELSDLMGDSDKYEDDDNSMLDDDDD
ncbi:MAG: DUF3134 family protein [Cyanobacteria bacterium]|nr:DUF3134 family protein [Cyanobacteriota bacterium]MEB3267820.1 DUF3134 family protein [Leptolyngbya sp.]